MKFQYLTRSFARFRAADRAVSPVIAVILMVAITVILAAVIGTFVLDVGADVEESPAAAFDQTYDPATGLLTITHVGGDSFSQENSLNVRVLAKGQTGTWDFDVESGSTFTVGGVGSGADMEVADAFEAGDEVKVVWTSTDGRQTNTVWDFRFA